jgi:hypothetical protein
MSAGANGRGSRVICSASLATSTASVAAYDDIMVKITVERLKHLVTVALGGCLFGEQHFTIEVGF